jgi:hypothetical protein
MSLAFNAADPQTFLMIGSLAAMPQSCELPPPPSRP